MFYVGIDVAKGKHDCCIISSHGEILSDVFSIPNNASGFSTLIEKIFSETKDLSMVKVWLEYTGHYSYNLLGFLLRQKLTLYLINPLLTNLYRKSHSFRKTKTDKIDSRFIASMMMSDVDLKPYSPLSYHSEELKSFTRYRFDKVKTRKAKNFCK